MFMKSMPNVEVSNPVWQIKYRKIIRQSKNQKNNQTAQDKGVGSTALLEMNKKSSGSPESRIYLFLFHCLLRKFHCIV